MVFSRSHSFLLSPPHGAATAIGGRGVQAIQYSVGPMDTSLRPYRKSAPSRSARKTSAPTPTPPSCLFSPTSRVIRLERLERQAELSAGDSACCPETSASRGGRLRAGGSVWPRLWCRARTESDLQRQTCRDRLQRQTCTP